MKDPMRDLHFWYSELQAQIILTGKSGDAVLDAMFARLEAIFPNPYPKPTKSNTCRVTIAGETVEAEYTECHSSILDHASRFEDSVYIGFGNIASVDGSREAVLVLGAEIERLDTILGTSEETSIL